MLMGHVCGQQERSPGAIISFLPFPSLISNPNGTKSKWFGGKKKNAPRTKNKGYCFPWREGRRKTRDQAEESDPKRSLRLCF